MLADVVVLLLGLAILRTMWAVMEEEHAAIRAAGDDPADNTLRFLVD